MLSWYVTAAILTLWKFSCCGMSAAGDLLDDSMALREGRGTVLDLDVRIAASSHLELSIRS